MTRLQLTLGNQFIWALVEPLAKEYIKEADEVGYQSTNLILTQSNPGPVEVELEALPKWARVQVITAIKSGQLVNTGDKIFKASEPQIQPVQKQEETSTTKTKAKSKAKSGSDDH